MASLVDVVNQALIRLGQGTIVALTDAVRAAKIANVEAVPLLDDELRRGLWKFAKQRTKLIADATAPAWGFAKSYSLPDGLGSDPWCVRAVEVDGEDDSSGRWVVEGRKILTDISGLSDSTAPTKTFLSSAVNAGTDRITIATHGYTAGDGPLRLRAGVGGLPGGLLSNVDYYVLVVDANTIQLALTSGGSAVDITSTAGTGPHTLGPTGLSLLYLARVSDPDQMDAAFRSLLVARYAAAWAEGITGNPTKVQECEARLASERRACQTPDSQQGRPDANEDTDWIGARFGGTAGGRWGAPDGNFGTF